MVVLVTADVETLVALNDAFDASQLRKRSNNTLSISPIAFSYKTDYIPMATP
jgi:hypothetical protein